MMHRNKSVDVHQFAMVPKADIPRSKFTMQTTHKTTFDAGLLVPVYVDEVLPGDTFNLNMTAFARLATPLFPVMDNLFLDSFFFFIPNRLVWQNWKRFMGEQTNPGDSISYVIPQLVSPVGGYAVGSVFDYMGLPTVGQVMALRPFPIALSRCVLTTWCSMSGFVMKTFSWRVRFRPVMVRTLSLITAWSDVASATTISPALCRGHKRVAPP